MGPIDILKAPMGLLGKQAALLLREAYGKPDRPFQNRFVSLADGRTQKLVQTVIDAGSLDASVETLTDRYIAPMAANLAGVLPRGVAFCPLELPSGHQAARQMWDDVSVRLITGWYDPPILDDEGEVIGYDPPVPVLRMDCLVTTEPFTDPAPRSVP